MILCTKCLIEKDESFFSKQPRKKNGFSSWCRECTSLKTRNIQRKVWYNITPEEYNELLSRQENKCIICRSPPGKRSLHIDHDHSTGEVRGLLCHTCNIGLGMFKDNTELLNRAIEYLRK